MLFKARKSKQTFSVNLRLRGSISHIKMLDGNDFLREEFINIIFCEETNNLSFYNAKILSDFNSVVK